MLKSRYLFNSSDITKKNSHHKEELEHKLQAKDNENGIQQEENVSPDEKQSFAEECGSEKGNGRKAAKISIHCCT